MRVRNIPRRFLLAGIFAILAIVVAAYVLTFLSYSAALKPNTPPLTPPNGGVAVLFTADDVNALDREIPGLISIAPSGKLFNDDGQTLKQDIVVEITGAVSGSTLRFPANELLTPQPVTLSGLGTIQDYPFDSYEVVSLITAKDKAPNGSTRVLGTDTVMALDLPGWVASDSTPLPLEALPGDWIGQDTIAMTVSRSVSTKMLAIILLALMAILGIAACLVMLWVVMGYIGAGFPPASWLAVMLFALLPLREFFPGSPPLGSWMDILLVFWVILTIIVSMVIVIGLLLAQARHKSPGSRLGAEPGGE